MTIEELVKDYEKKLNYIYARANTKSKRKKIAHDLLTFSNICSEHFGIRKSFAWEKDIKIIREIKNFYVSFVNDVVQNTSLYQPIFDNVLNTFLSSDYDIYDYDKIKYQRLTEKEKQELIFDFLASYDESLVKEFENKLNNYEMFEGYTPGYGGMTYPISCLNKSLIFCNPHEKNTIYDASILVHELGHNYEIGLFNSLGKGNYLDIAYNKPYYEVTSKFFEYAFVKYLEDNNIMINDVRKRTSYILFDLLSRTYNIHLMYLMEEVRIDELDNVYITEDNIANIASELVNKFNYYSFPYQDGDAIKFRHSFIYGIGGLFSIYLYDNYKEDPNNFKKEFKNVLLSYPYGNGIKEFERVGVTPELLIDGKVLKRVLDSRK